MADTTRPIDGSLTVAAAATAAMLNRAPVSPAMRAPASRAAPKRRRQRALGEPYDVKRGTYNSDDADVITKDDQSINIDGELVENDAFLSWRYSTSKAVVEQNAPFMAQAVEQTPPSPKKAVQIEGLGSRQARDFYKIGGSFGLVLAFALGVTHLLLFALNSVKGARVETFISYIGYDNADAQPDRFDATIDVVSRFKPGIILAVGLFVNFLIYVFHLVPKFKRWHLQLLVRPNHLVRQLEQAFVFSMMLITVALLIGIQDVMLLFALAIVLALLPVTRIAQNYVFAARSGEVEVGPIYYLRQDPVAYQNRIKSQENTSADIWRGFESDYVQWAEFWPTVDDVVPPPGSAPEKRTWTWYELFHVGLGELRNDNERPAMRARYTASLGKSPQYDEKTAQTLYERIVTPEINMFLRPLLGAVEVFLFAVAWILIWWQLAESSRRAPSSGLHWSLWASTAMLFIEAFIFWVINWVQLWRVAYARNPWNVELWYFATHLTLGVVGTSSVLAIGVLS